MDILAALEAEPARGKNECVIQRWVGAIDDAQPGRAALIDTITCIDSKAPEYRTLEQTTGILARLGLNTSETSIGAHRGRRCRCFW